MHKEIFGIQIQRNCFKKFTIVYADTEGCVSVYLCIYTLAHTCLKCAPPTYMRKKYTAYFKQWRNDKQIVKE